MKASTKKTLWILALIAVAAGGVYYFTMSGETSSASGRNNRHKGRGNKHGFKVYNSVESALINGKRNINLGAQDRQGYCGNIPFAECQKKGYRTCEECSSLARS